MLKLTKAQEKHLDALTMEFVTVEGMRKKFGFSNSNTLYKLLEMGLVETSYMGESGSFEAVLVAWRKI